MELEKSENIYRCELCKQDVWATKRAGLKLCTTCYSTRIVPCSHCKKDFVVDPSAKEKYDKYPDGGCQFYIFCSTRCIEAADKDAKSSSEQVNHPKHYNLHPAGIECIDVIEHMTLNVGNAVKYLWRAGLKNEGAHVQDLEKAVWYINREIERLKKEKKI